MSFATQSILILCNLIEATESINSRVNLYLFQNSLQTHGETIKSRTRRDSLENDVSFDNDLQQNRRNTSVDTAPDESFDMKRAKFDVMMLGIKGLDKVNQEKARMDVAVKLGAQVLPIIM